MAADPGFAQAGDSLPAHRLVGTWRISGYDDDPDQPSDLLGVVPNFQPLDAVLRRDGTVNGGLGPIDLSSTRHLESR